jgi:hypothetical protein
VALEVELATTTTFVTMLGTGIAALGIVNDATAEIDPCPSAFVPKTVKS